MTNSRHYFSTSLEKGLKILSLFNGETSVLTQSEISRVLGLNVTSTYRYINTFVHLGYLEKDPKTKELRPGFRSLTLCSNLIRATDHLQLVKNYVDSIYKKYNITIDVGLTVDDTMMRVYHKEAEETLTYNLPDVAKNCLHNTSVGKAFLSTLTADELEQVLDRIDLRAKTIHTICEKEALMAEIEKTRAQGYAMCIEEYLPGLITIGAPLINPSTKKGIGAVSFDFSVLQNSAEEIKEKYRDLIKDTAAALSERLHR
ncbi:MAG: IclR family transcriptional regulator [Deltaproteobacteria bacterium]|nr:IclR family transcriptional regulator [Deltaproteobacteria bacterium]